LNHKKRSPLITPKGTIYNPNTTNTKMGIMYSLQTKGLIIKRISQVIGTKKIFTGHKTALNNSQTLALKMMFLQFSFLKILKNSCMAITINKLLIMGKNKNGIGQ
tara:strand:+ start:2660 stop:2974 length:315 start_codon:yes stop_codon:yes gene_type:complete